MSNQQSGGVWQKRQSQSASRTPNRSGTASPSQGVATAPSPRPEGARSSQPPNNVWAQRSNSASGSNGPIKAEVASQNESGAVNGFNAGDVKAFLGRDAGTTAVYKPADAAGGARPASAWGSKPNTMANGQSFFAQLAKQVATLEGGG